MGVKQIRKQSYKIVDNDFELQSLIEDDGKEGSGVPQGWRNLRYLFAGLLFGVVLVKSEVISWFRIQEMFRLQSFHMYGSDGIGRCCWNDLGLLHQKI